jgi:thiol:disulfide interchange protein DsbD
MNSTRQIACIAAVALLSVSGPIVHNSRSQSTMRAEMVSASLLAEVQTIQAGEPFWVAIELTMLDGWHVNWINPGDAGLAPTVKWSLPAGFEASELLWPYPERFEIPELSIFGYEGRVLLLSRITPPETLAEGPAAIAAHVDWLACRESCVPGQSDIALNLKVRHGPPAHDEWVDAIATARAKVPVTSDVWQFRAKVTGNRVTILALRPEGESIEPDDVVFFPTEGGVIEHAAAQRLHREPSGFKLDMEKARMSTGTPSRIQGVLVSGNGWGTTEQRALFVNIPVDS